MNKLKIILFIIITYFLYLNSVTNAAINFTVSPPLYEINAFTWTTVSKSAQLRNNSDIPVTIYTTSTDFQSNWSSWVPQFVRYSELVHPDQQLSTWINIDTTSFTINPNEERTINFTLSIPNDATPGWHYWAVCFKNNKSETSNGANININVDYCILMLVKVDWEIVTDADVHDTIIHIWAWGNWWHGNSDLVEDICPIMDLTSSNFDWKCIDDFFNNDDLKDDVEKLNTDDNPDTTTSDDFDISFNTPIVNEWNTHLSPSWNITLIDENWNTIKWIWKESVKNELWAKIWDKIVDYLPINDEWWNVLPWQTRDFIAEWKWFPYESYDENWKKIIKYWTPEEYYTKKNMSEWWYIFPWQRINERINNETIKANINIKYKNKDWEDVEFNSADEFDVKYKEKYVWTNPYAVICFITFLLVVYILWLIFRKKKRKCVSCKKKIDKDMHICPYCWVIQDDEKYANKRRIKKHNHIENEELLEKTSTVENKIVKKKRDSKKEIEETKKELEKKSKKTTKRVKKDDE